MTRTTDGGFSEDVGGVNTNVWLDGYVGRSGKKCYYYLTFEENTPHQKMVGLGPLRALKDGVHRKFYMEAFRTVKDKIHHVSYMKKSGLNLSSGILTFSFSFLVHNIRLFKVQSYD